MKVICKQKYSEILDDDFIEVQTKINNIVIKDNYYGFTARQAKKIFRADLKRKIKTNSRFRSNLFNSKTTQEVFLPKEITLAKIKE